MVKGFNCLHDYGFILTTDSSCDCECFVHRNSIFPSAVTTSPSPLRDGEVVSFTVEEGRIGVEASKVAALEGVRVLDSFHTRGRKTTYM